MSKFQELTGRSQEKLRELGGNFTALKGSLMESARQSARDFLGVQPHEITAIQYEEDAEQAIQTAELHTAETMRDADIAIQALRECDPIVTTETELQRLNTTVDARLNEFDEREREVRAIPTTLASSHGDIQELGQLENTVQTLTAEVQASTPLEQSAPNEGITAIGRRIQVWSEVDAVRSAVFTARMNEYVRTRQEPSLQPHDTWDVPQCIKAIQGADEAARPDLATKLNFSQELVVKILEIVDSDTAVTQAQENAAKEAEFNQKKQQLAAANAKLAEYSDLAEKIRILHESRIEPVAENVAREKAKRETEAQQVRVHIVEVLTQTRSEAVAMLGWRLSTNELRSLMESSVVLPAELNDVALGSLLAGGSNEKLVNEILMLIQQLQEQTKEPTHIDQSITGIFSEVRGGNNAVVLVRLLVGLMTECGQSDAQLAGELTKTIPLLEPDMRQVAIGAGLDPSHKELAELMGKVNAQGDMWTSAQTYADSCAKQAVHLKERVAMCERKVPIVGGTALAPVDMGSFGTSAELPSVETSNAELARIKAEILTTLQKVAQPSEQVPISKSSEVHDDIKVTIQDLVTTLEELADRRPITGDTIDRMIEITTKLISIYESLGATSTVADFQAYLATVVGLKTKRSAEASAGSGPPAEAAIVIPEIILRLDPLIKEASIARQQGDVDNALRLYKSALQQAMQYQSDHPEEKAQRQIGLIEEEIHEILSNNRTAIELHLSTEATRIKDDFLEMYGQDSESAIRALSSNIDTLQPDLQGIHTYTMELRDNIHYDLADHTLRGLFDPVVRTMIQANDTRVQEVMRLGRRLVINLTPQTAETRRMNFALRDDKEVVERANELKNSLEELRSMAKDSPERAQALESLADELAQSPIAVERMKALEVYKEAELAYYTLGSEADKRQALDISARRHRLQDELEVQGPRADEFELVGTMIEEKGPPFDHKEIIDVGDNKHVEVGIDEHKKPDASNPLPRVWIYDDKIGGEALPIQPTPDGKEVRSGDYGGLILVAEALPLEGGQWLVRAHVMRIRPSAEPVPPVLPEGDTSPVEAQALAVGGTPPGPPVPPRVESGAQPPKPPRPDRSPDGDGDGGKPAVETLPLNPEVLKIGEPAHITLTDGKTLPIPIAGSSGLSIVFDSDFVDFNIWSAGRLMASINKQSLSLSIYQENETAINQKLGIGGFTVSEITAITRNAETKQTEKISFILTLTKKEVVTPRGFTPLPPVEPTSPPPEVDYAKVFTQRVDVAIQALRVPEGVKVKIEGPLRALFSTAGHVVGAELTLVQLAKQKAETTKVPYLGPAVIAIAELVQATAEIAHVEGGPKTLVDIQKVCEHLVNWLVADMNGGLDLAKFLGGNTLLVEEIRKVINQPEAISKVIVQVFAERKKGHARMDDQLEATVGEAVHYLMDDPSLLETSARALQKHPEYSGFVDRLRKHIAPKETPAPVEKPWMPAALRPPNGYEKIAGVEPLATDYKVGTIAVDDFDRDNRKGLVTTEGVVPWGLALGSGFKRLEGSDMPCLFMVGTISGKQHCDLSRTGGLFTLDPADEKYAVVANVQVLTPGKRYGITTEIFKKKEVPKVVVPVEQPPIVLTSGDNLYRDVRLKLYEPTDAKKLQFSMSPEVFKQFLLKLDLPMEASINPETKVTLSQNGSTSSLKLEGSFDAKGGNSRFIIVVESDHQGKLVIVGKPKFEFALRHSPFSGKIKSALTNLSDLLANNIQAQLVNDWSFSRIDIQPNGLSLSLKHP